MVRETATAPTFKKSAKKADVEKTLIFTVEDEDGVETEYYIENRARPNLSYGYMRRMRQIGQAEAESWMMEKVLGAEALEALEGMEDLTPEEDTALRNRVQAITMGGAELPKG